MKKALSLLLIALLAVPSFALVQENPEAIDASPIGATTASTGAFTTLTASGAVTINDASADVDTRIESDGNANMLFVDGGDDAVGIGKDPASGVELDVSGDLAITGYFNCDLPAVSSVVTANTITANAMIIRVQGTGNAIDLSSNPQISAGVAGQILYLVGEDDTNTVTIDDGNGVQTAAAASHALGDGDVLTLYYDDDASVWREISFSNN